METTYYWHVRALNSGGTTYANGSATAFWTFTTDGAVPGAFTKSLPINGATGISISPTLTWGASAGAASYEYCYDTSNDSACSVWTSNGTLTSKSLSGLNKGTTYYWHVRAINANGSTYAGGSATAFWSFTTIAPPPADFTKSAPADGAAGQSTSLTLSWSSSAGATSYEYCYDTTDNNNCSGWTGTGASTNATLSGLDEGTAYYWHVRAISEGGSTYANGSATAFWSFTTGLSLPGAFNKTSPLNTATGQETSLVLTWTASSAATHYEFCIDTSNDNACSAWTDNGNATSISLSDLDTGETYYWQVKAVNAGGSAFADDGAWWSFTSVPTFSDVAYTHWAWSWIERLYSSGITTGCGNSPLVYCPDQTVTRAQMAVFLERGKNGSSYTPLGATGIFDDVPTTYWAAGYIEQLYNDGITTGCATSPLKYCPENPVTRDQMAVFLLRAKYGKTYTPPPATGIFNDVPTSHWAAAWIEQLFNEGFTNGCGSNNYCPSQVVNRAQMAAFLVRTFGLP